ncbi:hypothetical protein Tco_0358820 [Tanacetum coccineum]
MPFRRRPGLWQDIKSCVLIQNAFTDVLEVNGRDRAVRKYRDTRPLETQGQSSFASHKSSVSVHPLSTARNTKSLIAMRRTLCLSEIHVTWAHLEKKRTRLRTCTKIHQEVLLTERRDGIASIKRRCRDLSGDGVWILATASQRSRLKMDLEPSTWRRR